MSSGTTFAAATTAFSGTARVNYLSTLHFDEQFLQAVQSSAEGVEVRQIPAADLADIDASVWASVDVLHTSSVFPDPTCTPRLKWVQLDTSGVDHLHDEALWNSDIPITTIGGVSPVPLAEYVLWAILGSAHRLPALLDVRQMRAWPRADQRWTSMMPGAVRGATVAIVGYGRIGREIGRLANAFGMTVLGVSRTGGSAVKVSEHHEQYDVSSPPRDERTVDRSPEVELFGPDRLHDVLARADYLVVVVPLTARTANLVDAAALAALKPGAVVVNVARGGIVDERALRQALRTGRVRSAVLDVFDREPLPPEDPWWTEPNVFVTPHVSGLAPRYSAQVLDLVRDNLRRLVAGRALLNVVNREHGY